MKLVKVAIIVGLLLLGLTGCKPVCPEGQVVHYEYIGVLPISTGKSIMLIPQYKHSCEQVNE